MCSGICGSEHLNAKKMFFLKTKIMLSSTIGAIALEISSIMKQVQHILLLLSYDQWIAGQASLGSRSITHFACLIETFRLNLNLFAKIQRRAYVYSTKNINSKFQNQTYKRLLMYKFRPELGRSHWYYHSITQRPNLVHKEHGALVFSDQFIAYGSSL